MKAVKMDTELTHGVMVVNGTTHTQILVEVTILMISFQRINAALVEALSAKSTVQVESTKKMMDNVKIWMVSIPLEMDAIGTMLT